VKKERVVHVALVVSMILHAVTISYILMNDNDYENRNLNDNSDSSKKNEIEIKEFQYSEFNLTLDEELINGKYSFNYSRKYRTITVRDIKEDELVCHFWKLKDGYFYGIKGFMMEIISLIDNNITFRFSHYNETDYLGKGVYFGDLPGKSFSFGGNESLIYQHYYPGNDTAQIKVLTPLEDYIIWLPAVNKTNLGFINVWLRHGGPLECT
jgi:hypothetical protein